MSQRARTETKTYTRIFYRTAATADIQSPVTDIGTYIFYSERYDKADHSGGIADATIRTPAADISTQPPTADRYMADASTQPPTAAVGTSHIYIYSPIT